ncbi:hepatitis A virus cellular receptor 1 homolog isoform X2 [Trichosurus vulpecula]|uniref:hepatitis A virus cellular receptor 1 homolog isoform X2 n=1 Tax=Trichosurus vulpecula TaxID=9337 RepID=UPI00186AD1E4|nr:hepatitis A virus cellular receptor 1 homolog isoform X2 [Trichosurus vulpecula]
MGLPVLFCCILMVLLAGPSMSMQTVRGIVGQSVTLPCTYSVKDGVTSMCWGRGWCPLNGCSNEILWTDGHKMTFQHSNRYHLKEDLSKGIVSLTIANLTEADAGMYCCRVEIAGWFNDQKVTVKLKVEQVSSTPVLDIVTTTRPSQTLDGKNWTQPDIPIGVNDTMTGTSEGYQYENKTVILHDQLVTTNEGIYIGAGFFVGVLLIMVLLVFVLKRYFCNRKNAQTLSLTFLAGRKNEAVSTAAEDGNRVEDNVYTIEDNVYIVEEENAYIIDEEENPYVVPTSNEKQQPSKVGP